MKRKITRTILIRDDWNQEEFLQAVPLQILFGTRRTCHDGKFLDHDSIQLSVSLVMEMYLDYQYDY